MAFFMALPGYAQEQTAAPDLKVMTYNIRMATMKDGLKRVVYEYNGAKPTSEIVSAPSASPREKPITSEDLI